MKKKFLALVLTLAMVLSLVPVTALAVDVDTQDTPANGDVITYQEGTSRENYPEGLTTLNKQAEKISGKDNQYQVTLTVGMSQTKNTVVTSTKAATVLVIDISNSMGCTKEEHKHNELCYNQCTPESKPEHWKSWGWGNYSHKWEYNCWKDTNGDYHYRGEQTLTCTKEEHSYNDNCHTRLTDAKDAARAFVETYAGSVPNAGRNLAIVVFNRDASVALPWTDASTNKADVLTAIDNISLGDKSAGSTNLEQGLSKAGDLLGDSSLNDISKDNKNIIALTDGAPTHAKDASNRIGDGTSGSAKINRATFTTATAVKNAANLYTVCFGAADQYTYMGTFTDGPTVGEFLEDSIASKEDGKTYAYNADNADQLNEVFEELSKTITSGLSAGTVHDALPAGVSSSAFGNSTKAEWDLSSFTKTEEQNGDRTDYTYTKTYTVTIDPEKIDTSKLKNGYYPLNEPTTLTVKTGDTNTVLDFPIPAGKVTAKITYVLDGGKNAASNPKTYVCGVGVDSFANATKTGYTFGGWYSDSSYTNKVTNISKTEVGNKTLYAKWEKDDHATKELKYTVEYRVDSQTGTKLASEEVTVRIWKNDDTYAVASVPSKTFDGYKLAETGSTALPATVRDGDTIYVIYEKDNTATKELKYTVEYRVDSQTGTKLASEEVTVRIWKNDDTYAVASVPSKTFDGYKLAETGSTALPATVRDGDTIYVIYEKDNTATKELKYTVEYRVDSQTGTKLASEEVTVRIWKNDDTYAVASVPSKTFDGYKLAETGSTALPATVRDGDTIYVIYEKDNTATKELKYTVEYRVDSQTGTKLASEEVTVRIWKNDDTYAVASVPSKTFDGYKLAETGSTALPATVKNGDTIYVIYEKDNTATKELKYTVEYRVDSQTGTKLASEEVTVRIWKNDDTYSVASVPSKTFDGYKLAETGSTALPATVRDGDTIYVIYEKDNTATKELKYTVEYRVDSQTGTKLASEEVTVRIWKNDDTYSVASVPSKTFDGYKLAETGSTALPATVKNGDTIYVIYEKKLTYTINQHFMDGKGKERDDLRVNGEAQMKPKDTPLSDLIEGKTGPQSKENKNYVYVSSKTTYTVDQVTNPLNADSKLTKDTTIDLYYYLDNWKDAGEAGKDSETGGDGIPDCYQVLVNYKSGDTNRGSVGPLTMEVLTIKDATGNLVNKGTVKASGSTATATGSRCYFSSWTTNADVVNTSKEPATLGQQTFTAEGGKTYTFTANFGRSSGGSNRPKPPVVEIPDDVPTGLNGKDHYAYVVGYPDGMVYPQKNITRAEVATIFFRLLKDETREANMTKSNGYNDMKDGAWYTCAVSTLSKMGIIKGYEDGSFKPDASISRAEFAAIAARFDPDGDKTPATFSDVSSHWAKDEISIAANHGWIKGYEDGSFKPDQKITRAETMTLVNRVLKRLPETKDDLHKDMKTWPDNQNESAWFYLAVQEATNSHYQKLKKDGTHEKWESMRETRDWAALEK